jgi:hypothetical protein
MSHTASGPAFLLLVTTLCLGLGACKGLDPATEEGRVEATLALMDASGEANDTFQAGEAVVMELTVRNRSDEDKVFRLSSSQRYDFEVHDQQLVWRWSSGLAFAQVITHLELPAGGVLVFKETWDQTDNDGKPVPPGRFEAEGFVPGKSDELYADPVAFRIE